MDHLAIPGRSATREAAAAALEPPRTDVAPPAPDLGALVVGMASGDTAALGRLYDATASRIYSLALRILGNAASAEEAMLDVYMQAWRNAARYDERRAPVLAWLLMMCRSRALDALRARDEPLPDPDPDDLSAAAVDALDPSDGVAQVQLRRSIAAALATLDATDRQLIALAFYRGLTHGELAAHTGLPLGTVKTRIRRALRKLRDVIGIDRAGEAS